MGREKKQIVLIVFEGLSDYDALFVPISRLYEEIDESVEVMPCFLDDDNQKFGDITSKYGVKPEKIEEIMTNKVFKPIMNNYGIYPKDILEILHFVDTDGAYVPDEMIVLNDKEKTVYGDCIYTNNVNKMVERNMHKRANLDYLMSLTDMKVVSKKRPYSVYYCSSNLDHVISNDANMEPSSKRQMAKDFCQKSLSSTNEFMSFFDSVMPPAVSLEYQDTWSYIREDNHSLLRCSNIGVLIHRLCSR